MPATSARNIGIEKRTIAFGPGLSAAALVPPSASAAEAASKRAPRDWRKVIASVLSRDRTAKDRPAARPRNSEGFDSQLAASALLANSVRPELIERVGVGSRAQEAPTRPRGGL